MHQLNRERKRQQKGFLQFYHAFDPLDYQIGDRNYLQKYLSLTYERRGDRRNSDEADQWSYH
jgi:hypothetical protein